MDQYIRGYDGTVPEVKYCCDVFKYMVETGQYHWYDDVCAVLCEDCRRHNGMNHKFCFNCGTKIRRKSDDEKI